MSVEKHPPAGIGQQDPRALGEDPLLAKAEQLIGVDLSSLGDSMAEIPLPASGKLHTPKGGGGGGGFVNENIQGRQRP